MSYTACTEIALLQLKAGIKADDFSDPSTETGTVVVETLKKILKIQPGCQRVYFGPQIEHPDVVAVFVDWDSIQSHKDFMTTLVYGPFFQTLFSLLDDGNMFHVSFQPSSPHKVTSNGGQVTEVVVYYFPSDYSEAKMEEFEALWEGFSEHTKKAEGFTGVTLGWSHESEIEYATAGKSKVYVGALGWESIDAHMAYRDSKVFSEGAASIRGKATRVEMTHVKFVECFEDQIQK